MPKGRPGKNGKGKAAPSQPPAVTRKRKAEEAQGSQDDDNNVVIEDHEDDTGEDGEVTIRKWRSPGESSCWDDTPPLSLSTPDQLAVVVPLGTKQKIWAGGFVNLANFLPRIDDEGQCKLQVIDGDLVKKTTIRRITNANDWTSCFVRYMGIYCDRNPAKIAAVCRYVDTVRLAAEKFGGLGWRAYDEQFRLLVAENPDKDWAHIDNHLWLLCMTQTAESVRRGPTNAYANESQKQMNGGFPRQQKKATPTNQSPGGSNRPNSDTGKQPRGGGSYTGRFCKYFNYGKCSNQVCNYPHVCRKCGGDHTVSQCKKQN